LRELEASAETLLERQGLVLRGLLQGRALARQLLDEAADAVASS